MPIKATMSIFSYPLDCQKLKSWKVSTASDDMEMQ